MDKSYNNILSILKSVRIRLTVKNLLTSFIIGFCFVLGIGIFMALLSRLMPIYNVYLKWVYVAVISALGIFVYTFCSRPSLKKCAEKVDALGLKERVSTALEIREIDSKYKESLVEDALDKLKILDYKEKIKLIPSKRWLVIFFSLAFLLVGTFILPNPLKETAEKKHELSAYKKEQKKKIDAAEKEVKEKKNLTEEQKKELLSKLSELKKQINSSKEMKEVDKALEKTAKKLELNKKEKLSEDLKKLEEKLALNNETKKLSEALKNKDIDKLQKELENLKNKANSMDKSSKDKLQKALSEASKDLRNEDIQEALNDLNSALSSGNEDAISKSVSKVSGKLKSALTEEELNNTLAQLQQELQNGQQSGKNTAQGKGAGNGQGQGQSQGAGSGQGNSSGSGQGNGAGGSGAGSGTSNKDGGVTNYGSGGIANKQPTAGKSKEYEKIYAPKRLGGEGETTKLTGKNNGNSVNSENSITENSNAELGDLVPYNQVAGEYSERAMENLNSYEIPDGMMDLVKDYFTSLQE